MTGRSLLIIIDPQDIRFASSMRGAYSQFNAVHIKSQRVDTSHELRILAKSCNATHILTTRLGLIKRVDKTLQGTASDNYGYCTSSDYTGGLPILFVPPLQQIRTVSYGSFILSRYLRKLHSPESFVKLPVMIWDMGTAQTLPAALALFAKAKLIAVDIETRRDPLLITSIQYTAWFGGNKSRTIVLPFSPQPGQDCEEMFSWATRFNQLPAPKIMQNGQYDAAWFIRFNIPLYNYLFDTYNMMHCYLCELPKDLAFMSSFFLLNFRFWKNESTSNLYEYGAKDTHNTLFLFLAMMAEMPAYALNNYQIEFPLIFPSLHSGLEGIAVDPVERGRLRAIEQEKSDTALAELQHLLGLPTFNPGSPTQVLNLMHALGYKQAKSTDKIEMQKFSEAHVLFTFVADLIRKVRKANKAISTYYDMSLICGRLSYKIDPAGTDSGRMASQAGPFWTGTQIQNIPAYCKPMFIADPGYKMSEVDNEQSESRCTAYISEDPALIDAVENSPDFHCQNASLFFGIPFDKLYDAVAHKVLRKDIRTVSKRVNHGANYNMGPDVLVDTMGTRDVLGAGRLLGLPAGWPARRIAEHLLACFHKAYPNIAQKYYKEAMLEVTRTGMLVGATGWARRTFLKPEDSKLDKNSVVAHHPQSLSVMLVNQAYFAVWKQLQIKERKLRLKAQIHDSLLFQYKPEDEAYVVNRVSELMRIPCTVNGRVMVIPNAPKFGADSWGDLKD